MWAVWLDSGLLGSLDCDACCGSWGEADEGWGDDVWTTERRSDAECVAAAFRTLGCEAAHAVQMGVDR